MSLQQNYIRVLANEASHFISAHPNAGLPNEFGEYDQSPEEMALDLRPFLEEQLINIIGAVVELPLNILNT